VLGIGINLWNAALGGGGVPVNPVQTNLAAWFKFGIGITSSGGLVSQWDDASGNARHLIQATGTNQPALQGDNSILFDGVDNFMKCDAFTLNQPFSIYIRGRHVTWTSGRYWCDGNTTPTGAILMLPVTPQLQIHAGANVGSNGALAVNTYGAIGTVFNGASSILRVDATSQPGLNPGAGNPGGFTLGARGDNTLFSNIQVKEIILYSVAHDASTMTQIINYLNLL
jgi:hypothetical protein